MGLTIHYSLQTRGGEARARQLISKLHQTALDLPFLELGEIVELTGEACDHHRRDKDDPLRWPLCQAQASVLFKRSQSETAEQGEAWIRVTPTHYLAFNAGPGEGCEESNFGLCRYPAEIATSEFGVVKTGLSGWRWRSFCKTQYASNPDCGGITNFLRCHLTVIALLDQARKLGCLVEVDDESGFWEQRDLLALQQQIGSWNEMLAAFGGKLKDLLGDGVESAIHSFPNFETLEAAGQSQLSPETELLVQLIQRVIGEKRQDP